jgi:hypothetical protein
MVASGAKWCTTPPALEIEPLDPGVGIDPRRLVAGEIARLEDPVIAAAQPVAAEAHVHAVIEADRARDGRIARIGLDQDLERVPALDHRSVVEREGGEVGDPAGCRQKPQLRARGLREGDGVGEDRSDFMLLGAELLTQQDLVARVERSGILDHHPGRAGRDRGDHPLDGRGVVLRPAKGGGADVAGAVDLDPVEPVRLGGVAALGGQRPIAHAGASRQLAALGNAHPVADPQPGRRVRPPSAISRISGSSM